MEKDIKDLEKEQSCGCGEAKEKCSAEAENNQEVSGQDDLTDKINNLEKELDEWKLAYTRKLADFQNYSKRKDNEAAELRRFATEELILKLLGNVDNLERAISSSKETTDFNSLAEGVEMTLKGINEVLKAEGLEVINADGNKFDPYEHQPMITGNNPEKENDTVLEVFQKGYKLKGKVIRPAMVMVNKKD